MLHNQKPLDLPMVPASKDAKKYTMQIKDIKLCHKVLFSTDECHLQGCLLEWLSMTPTTDQNPHRLTDTKYRNKHCVALSGYSNGCNVSWWETRRVCSVRYVLFLCSVLCMVSSVSVFPSIFFLLSQSPDQLSDPVVKTVGQKIQLLWEQAYFDFTNPY